MSGHLVLSQRFFPELDGTDFRWLVLHTRSRQEKVVFSDLRASGAACYLPLVRQARYYGRRKAHVDVPLFPGYVFLFGAPDQAYEVDRRKRLARIIDVSDEGQLEWELRNIRLALSKDADLLPHRYLEEGMRVEVRAGPFKGLQGMIERFKKDGRLVLQVHSFGGAVSLEIDQSLLQPLD